MRVDRLRIGLVPAFLAAAVSGACGGAVPSPPADPQPSDAYETVPYPPPSALIEIVPPAPNPEARWIDGYWVWRGRYYVWERGGWVLPPDGATVSKWDARYLDDGTLLYAPTVWYDARDRPMSPPPFLLPAATPPSEKTAEPTTVP
jgi:hypothetical protein